MTAATEKTTQGRLLSLDILRGITIAGMILVNNPGSYNAIYAPLHHAEWNGLTPTDLVFPFFMFIMGISMYFSLRKFQFKPSGHLLWKIVKRTVLIYAIGLAIAWFGDLCNGLAGSDQSLPLLDRVAQAASGFGTLRLVGVMQRLAICYFFGSIVAITLRHKQIPWLIALLLVAYAVILLVGHGYDFAPENVIYIFDSALLGESHMYRWLSVGGVNMVFDPEGLLSTLPCIAHVLIGLLCGEAIMKTKDNGKRTNDLFITGTILTFAGLLLSYGLPINKNVWSPTFVLVTCGLAASLLGLLIWVIDIKGHRSWCRFFEVFGINPLFLYVMGSALGILFGTVSIAGTSIQGWLCGRLILPVVGDEYMASCLYAILFVLINWCIGYLLYKKKIYIKI